MSILRHRVEPKQGHALFFPFRKVERVVIGRPAKLWRWSQEEFKQIQLGDFAVPVAFGLKSPNPPAKTSDNLPCKAEVIFRLRVSENAESLEKSTRTCSVSRDEKTTISHAFFKSELQSELEAIVERCIRKIAYLDLLKSPERTGTIEEAIQTEARNQAANNGFTLIGCRADIEMVELSPEALAQSTELKKHWNAYLDEKKVTQIEAKRREEELKNEIAEVEAQSKLVRDKKESDFQIEKENVVADRNARSRELRVKDEEDKLGKKKKSDEIQRTIQALDAKIQKEKLEYDQEIEKLKITLNLGLEKEEQDRRYEQEKEELIRRANLAEMTRQEETKERQSDLERYRNELELDKLRAQRADLQQNIAEIESRSIGVIGKAQAEVDKEKALAANAHIMKMNETLFSALPHILEKAYTPTERLGEIKVLYLGGRNSELGRDGKAPMENALGAILSSMSAIPMVKEVLRFLKEWDMPVAESSSQLHVSSSNTNKPNQHETGDGKQSVSQIETNGR